VGARGGVIRASGRAPAAVVAVVAAILVAVPFPGAPAAPAATARGAASTAPSGAVANFTAALNRLVELVGLAGSAILTLVWARVALSWFSNDLTKKIQAKDRARDALIGTLLFVAAVSGLVWGLAHWVVTGT
jgi:hypothetical protein